MASKSFGLFTVMHQYLLSSFAKSKANATVNIITPI